jgi:hypothetical protein
MLFDMFILLTFFCGLTVCQRRFRFSGLRSRSREWLESDSQEAMSVERMRGGGVREGGVES